MVDEIVAFPQWDSRYRLTSKASTATSYTLVKKDGGRVKVTLAYTDYPESDEAYDRIVCRYSRVTECRVDMITLGAVMPQVRVSFACSSMFGVAARVASLRMFEATEQNCNTCRSLTRVSFDRKYFTVSGLMPGKCDNLERKPTYKNDGENIVFAPDDCMLQERWSSR